MRQLLRKSQVPNPKFQIPRLGLGIWVLGLGIFLIVLPLAAQAPQGRAGGAGRGGRGDNPLGSVGALGQEVKRPPVQQRVRRRGCLTARSASTASGSARGPVNDIAQGLPKGETLPLLPASVKLMEYRAQHETDDPHLWCMPMGVPRSTPYPFRFVQDITGGAASAHLFIIHEGNIHSYPSDLHGRPEASGGARPDVVRTLDRALGKQGHARHRHRRLQRQVLVRSQRDAAHRAAAHRSSAGRGRTWARSSTP